MNISIKILLSAYAVFFVVIFLFLARKKSIKTFYTSVWFFMSIILISLVVFERFVKSIANFVGISDASFMVIVGLISFLLIYVLHISIKLSEMSNKIQELISYSAILEYEIRKIKTNNN